MAHDNIENTLNCHLQLHANYGDINEYEGHRVSECWELAGRLRASAAQGRQIIVVNIPSVGTIRKALNSHDASRREISTVYPPATTMNCSSRMLSSQTLG